MNSRLILSLGCVGLLMGTASVFGLTERVEPLLWLFIAFGSAYWIARSRTGKPFLHGLIASVVMGLFNSIMQSVFFGRYVLNNPTAAKGFAQIPGAIPGRMFILFVGPAIGLTYGIVVGAFAVVAARLMKKSGQ